MEAYYDYKYKEKTYKIPKFISFFSVVFLSFFIFFSNATELSKPKQTEFNTASMLKTAFSFIKKEREILKGEKTDRINILFLGLPGEKNSAPNLTDSIIMVSIKPSTKQLALLSIPRDLLVFLEKENRYAKINSLFILNEKNPELLNNKIKEITNQDIHYYIALDITAVEKMIDSLGGINVFVKKDIYDPKFPTENFGVETFKIKKGWRYLDGETAIKYLRTRHSENGDFDRIKQQQAVIEALRKKIFGLNILIDLPTLVSIYKTTSQNIQTDIKENEIRSFFEVLRSISYDKVTNKSLNTGEENSLIKSGSFLIGQQKAFILKPKKGDFDYSEIRTLADNIFNLK